MHTLNTHTHTHTVGRNQHNLSNTTSLLNKLIFHFLTRSEMKIPNSWNHVTLKAGITLLLPVLHLDQKVRQKDCAKQISTLQALHEVSNTKMRHSIMPSNIY